MPEIPQYVVGLGANLGSRRASLAAALELLAARPQCALGRVSSLHESEPMGPPQPRYLNAAACVNSDLHPRELLEVLLEIEASLGRTRGERWGARAVDLDLLWAPEPFADARLVVPHPRLAERWFALGPLLEAAPELAPSYAEDLHRLVAHSAEGTAPALAPPGWHAGPHARIVRRLRDAALELEVTAADRAEALAATLTALGTELFGRAGCRASEALVLLHAAEPADAVHLALAHAARGFCFQRGTVSNLVLGRVDAHLLGRRDAAAACCPELLAVVERADDAGHTLFVTVRFYAPGDM
ncbi:MAG: 2-amino-4-hydroxy-6-hydroxymethyldihydropteridine diphosphokinase [Polyangiales bacterium]